MTNLIEIVNLGDTLLVDSRLIAQSLNVEHRNWKRTIQTYQTQIEEAFGRLRFENAVAPIHGGIGETYYLLNEEQATFVMTLSKNTPEVVACKIQLVKAFSEAKKQLLKLTEQNIYSSSGKLLTWNAFASEDALSEMIHSFVVGTCSYKFLDKEVPFINNVADKPKTRRLDFISLFPKGVTGYEIKLEQFTSEDVVTTLGHKSYYHILRNYVNKLDKSKNKKYLRKVKFVLMSPKGITEDAKKLLDLMPEVSFMSVQQYCWNHLNKAWSKKYSTQKHYLAGLAVNKYPQLFTPNTLEYLSSFNKPKLLSA